MDLLSPLTLLPGKMSLTLVRLDETKKVSAEMKIS